MEFPGQNIGVGSCSLLQGIFPTQGSNPRIETRSPTLQVDSLPAEPQRKPKNTGVGSLSLLQGIFLTQESKWGLQHCRQILYQLSYHGRPFTLLSCGRVALPGGVGWLGQRLTHKACRIYHCVFTEKVRQPLSGVHSRRLWAGLLPPVERHR